MYNFINRFLIKYIDKLAGGNKQANILVPLCGTSVDLKWSVNVAVLYLLLAPLIRVNFVHHVCSVRVYFYAELFDCVHTLCVCVCVVCICVCVCVCVCACACMCACVCVNTHLHIHTVHVCCMCVCVRVYVCMRL